MCWQPMPKSRFPARWERNFTAPGRPDKTQHRQSHAAPNGRSKAGAAMSVGHVGTGWQRDAGRVDRIAEKVQRKSDCSLGSSTAGGWETRVEQGRGERGSGSSCNSRGGDDAAEVTKTGAAESGAVPARRGVQGGAANVPEAHENAPERTQGRGDGPNRTRTCDLLRVMQTR